MQHWGTERVTECEWRHAPEARGGLWRIERKLESWVQDAKQEGSTFGARRGEANSRPMGATRYGGQMNDSIEDCVSPPYVETFNSKLIKRFRIWTRSRYVFSNFEIPMFFIWSSVMNIVCPFRTCPYSCIWLCNTIFDRAVRFEVSFTPINAYSRTARMWHGKIRWDAETIFFKGFQRMPFSQAMKLTFISLTAYNVYTWI